MGKELNSAHASRILGQIGKLNLDAVIHGGDPLQRDLEPPLFARETAISDKLSR